VNQSGENGHIRAARLKIGGEREFVAPVYQLLVCLGEDCVVSMEEGDAPFQPMHALLLQPEKAARVRCDGEAGFYAVDFDERAVLTSCLPALAGNSVMSDFFLHRTREPGHLAFIEADYLNSGMAALLELLTEFGPARDREDELIAQGVLCELLCAATESCFMHAVLAHDPGQEIGQKACACLLRSRGRLSLNEVADRCYCHANTVSRAVAATTGMGFGDFRNQVRLSFAARTLRSGSTTIRAAAAECGYQNMTNFYRQFMKVYGMLPGDYQALFMQ